MKKYIIYLMVILLTINISSGLELNADDEVSPGDEFPVDVSSTRINYTGFQYDIVYNDSFTMVNMTAGELLNGDAYFNSKDNTGFGTILGGGSFDKRGRISTINMIAGNETGYYVVKLDNVMLIDSDLNEVESSTDYVTILVNTPPELEPTDDIIIDDGTFLEVPINATDTDGDDIGIWVEEKPSGMIFDDATDRLYWRASEGTYSVNVTVSDDYQWVHDEFTITVLTVHPRWDVNKDGVVDIRDLVIVANNYSGEYSDDALPRYDVNQDGYVNIQDMAIVAAHFGELIGE